MQDVQLPNGLRLWAPSEREAILLYREVIETATYDRHGISVRDDDVVLDVGANVGIYALHLASKAKRLRLHVFEPVPSTFAMLERNAKERMPDAQVVLHKLGVSSAPGTATFEVPSNSFSATMRPKDVDGAVRERGIVTWSRAFVDDGVRAGILKGGSERLMRAIVKRPWLATIVMSPLIAADRLMNRLRTRRITCGLTTISEIIRTHALERIDLLKIDAEGAEEAVLEGIRTEDWERIRQVVVEVHDVDGRLERMTARLRSLGFHVVAEREDWAVLNLMGIQVVYCTRPAAQA